MKDEAALNTFRAKISKLIEEGEISPAKALSMLKEKELEEVEQVHEKYDEDQLQEIFKELESLIGLKTIKKLIKEIHAFVEIQKKREKENLTTDPLVLHMIFKGNPGTGKTTVARIIGKLFKEIGVLSKGHIIEIERADIVGEYIGHTAQKTREQLKKAMGGILFIDEAYALARGGEKDFGKEAIDTMVKAMEDKKDNLVLILAGYQQEMTKFLKVNPGLRSRFPIQIDFPDYSSDELMKIANLMLKDKEYSLTDESEKNLKRILIKEKLHDYNTSGNARLVRNVIEKAIRKQAVRLMEKEHVFRQELITISKEDLQEDDLNEPGMPDTRKG